MFILGCKQSTRRKKNPRQYNANDASLPSIENVECKTVYSVVDAVLTSIENVECKTVLTSSLKYNCYINKIFVSIQSVSHSVSGVFLVNYANTCH